MDRVLLPARGLNMRIEISMPEPARDPLLHQSSEDGATARATAGMWVTEPGLQADSAAFM